MKKNILHSILAITIGIYYAIGVSCTDFLDVVPDNIPTVDHAFKSRHEAEGFLFGIYSFLPRSSHLDMNPALTAGDEGWLIENAEFYPNPILWRIAQGQQNTQSPLAN